MMVDRTLGQSLHNKGLHKRLAVSCLPVFGCDLIYCGALCTVGWSDLVKCFLNDQACSIVGGAMVREIMCRSAKQIRAQRRNRNNESK